MAELSDLNKQIEVLIDELDLLKIIEPRTTSVLNKMTDNIELQTQLQKHKYLNKEYQ